ncbi:MAG: CBS domain-containing protein [Actinomycetota bacterium]|nr:CBS domain-containing protein [Actinomycetota bacterium]
MPERQVQEIMTHDPVTVDVAATLVDVARRMREHDIGAVIVTEADKARGILTDRDIVVRAVADGRDPHQVRVQDVRSADLETLKPQDSLDSAVEAMRRHDVRRLPVVDGEQPVGILSIGDLAVERDPDSALADISAASPNR